MGETPRYAWGGPQQDGAAASRPQPDPFAQPARQPAEWPAAPARPAWPGGTEQPNPAFAEQTTTVMPKQLPGQAGPYAWGAGYRRPEHQPGYEPEEDVSAAHPPRHRSLLGKLLLVIVGGAVLITTVAGGAFLLTRDERSAGQQVAVQTQHPVAPADPPNPWHTPGTGDAAVEESKSLFKTTDFFRKGERVRAGAVTYRWMGADTGYVCSERVKGKALEALVNQRNCAQVMRWLFVDPRHRNQVTVGLLLMQDSRLAARATRMLMGRQGAVLPLDPPEASKLKPLPADAKVDVRALTADDVVIFSVAAWSDGRAPATTELSAAAAQLRRLVRQRLSEARVA
ncbi:hypothetical protein [Carbonactinospora thermoautotrophica]|uniref:hypothetical protein n=1 Tax=Carbonactinospora thermoautotrophica TaxID=1469144 RepID=UPI000ACCA67F|nr:hypothetical protein [Carbonactinospora thermoautotrophica]